MITIEQLALRSERDAQDPSEIISLGGWELDEQATGFHGSAGFFHIYGWRSDAQAIPFGKVMEAIPEPDRQRVRKSLMSTLQTHEPFDIEHRVMRSGGGVRLVRSRGQIITDQNGAIRLVGTSHDITDFRLAHETLRQSEEKFRSLVANIPDVTWSAEAKGRMRYISPNVERISGFSSDEICEKSPDLWFGRIHRSDVKSVAEAYEGLFTSGKAFDLEYRLQRKDQHWIWIHDRAYRTYERERVRFADGILSDITERKRAEEMRDRFAAVVNSSDDAIISKTLDGTITAWNSGAEKLFGYSADEVEGKTIHLLLPPDRVYEETDIVARIARGEHIKHFETVRRKKDGGLVQVSVTISPIKDSRGAVVGASKIARDISESKRIETELRQAKEAAETANRAKSQFLANMSHEIRTPMNGVIGVAGLLLDTELTPEQRQYAELVRTSGEALLHVINDILDFSKIEARKLTLEKTDFDLYTVLSDAAAVLAIKAAEKGLFLNWELEPPVPRLLRGDPGRVRQVLLNLLGNAVKFTFKGKVEARVGLEAQDENKATLRFTVSDTGAGIRPDMASSLFEPFVQGDGSSTRRFGGTGLGLTISRQLVEMMGGQIGVESEEGAGSRFWFTAVFEKQAVNGRVMAANSRAAAISSPRSAAVKTPVTPQRARILLAEDNSTNQEVAVAILKKLGYRADLVRNGTEALRALRDADYDVILMDCEMPEMDGYEATRRIRQTESKAQIPIIAITADALSGDREKCLQAGMSDYLAKPIEPQQLRELLEKWLRPRASREDISHAGQPDLRTAPIFDQEELLARLLGEEDLARKVLAGFLADAPQQLLALKRLLERDDTAAARVQAHALKGASATVSAKALQAACCLIEGTLRANNLGGSKTALARLNEEFEAFKAKVKKSGWV